MKVFRTEMTLVCPSNWTNADCRKYLERLACSPVEKDSIRIEEQPDTKNER